MIILTKKLKPGTMYIEELKLGKLYLNTTTNKIHLVFFKKKYKGVDEGGYFRIKYLVGKDFVEGTYSIKEVVTFVEIK